MNRIQNTSLAVVAISCIVHFFVHVRTLFGTKGGDELVNAFLDAQETHQNFVESNREAQHLLVGGGWDWICRSWMHCEWTAVTCLCLCC